MFPTVGGLVPTKTSAVQARCGQVADPARISGHSARRSGAKRRAREGWPILAIQHLGCWASGHALEYVEEAYAERTGTGVAYEADEPKASAAWGARMAAAAAERAKVAQALGSKFDRLEAHCQQLSTEFAHEPGYVLTENQGRAHLHIRAPTHVSAPSWSWASRCGRRFAGSDFRLLSARQADECSAAW